MTNAFSAQHRLHPFCNGTQNAMRMRAVQIRSHPFLTKIQALMMIVAGQLVADEMHNPTITL